MVVWKKLNEKSMDERKNDSYEMGECRISMDEWIQMDEWINLASLRIHNFCINFLFGVSFIFMESL